SNVNLDSLGRFDPVSINRMMEIIAGRAQREALIRDRHLYRARVCGMFQGEHLSAATVRPNIGTMYRPANAEEVQRFVGLPYGEGTMSIGFLLHSPIALAVKDSLFW